MEEGRFLVIGASIMACCLNKVGLFMGLEVCEENEFGYHIIGKKKKSSHVTPFSTAAKKMEACRTCNSSTQDHHFSPRHLIENVENKQRVRLLLQMNTISLPQAKHIHSHFNSIGFELDGFTANHLLKIYSRYGALKEARSLFDQMRRRNASPWTTMIGAYVKHGNHRAAIELFWQMQEESIKPLKKTLLHVLHACACLAALAEGELIHAFITTNGFDSDVAIANSLVNMYAKCSSLDVARSVFDKMSQRDASSWNSIIAAYGRHGHTKEALHLYQQMQMDGMQPNKITFTIVLSACERSAALAEGELIHASIVDDGLESDVVLGTALVHMYGKCKRLHSARTVFEKVHPRDVICWTAIITAYAQQGYGKEALQLFHRMQQERVTPNKITLTSILGTCDNLQALPEGKLIHAYVIDSGFVSDVIVGTALIDMYGKCGRPKIAQFVFDQLEGHDVICWNSMISAYVHNGQGKEALQVFSQMQQKAVKPSEVTFINALGACAVLAALTQGKLIHQQIIDAGFGCDVVMGNALISMYRKCGALEDALTTFHQIGQPDVISWTAIISVYAEHGHGSMALQLFREMQQEGVKPDALTFVSLLSACSHAGLVHEGHCYFISMMKEYGIIPTMEHYSCIIDLFGRAGKLNEAESIIHKMPLLPDLCVWMTLLSACRLHLDVERGKRAAENAMALDTQNKAPCVLLSNLYNHVQ